MSDATEPLRCPSCGAPHDEGVCPSCGGLVMRPHVVDEFRVSDSHGWSLRMSPAGPPNWTQLWATALRELKQLETVYADPDERGGPRRTELEDAVWQFFVDCYSLRDWLRGVASVPVKLSDTHPTSLWLACGIANTRKHMFPKGTVPNAVLHTVIGSNGIRFEFEIDDPMHGVSSVDALALARACVAAWREILAASGLTEP